MPHGFALILYLPAVGGGTYLDFSILPLATSWDARLLRSDKLRSVALPENRKCKWLPAAAKYCGGSVPTGGTCLFPQ